MRYLNLTRVTLLAACIVISSALFSQDAVDRIRNKERSKREEIYMRDQAHQQRILAKFNRFYDRVKAFAPDLKLRMPVHPGYADDIKENDNTTRVSRTKIHYAYVGEPYKLRSKPLDSDKQYLESLTRGTKVEVVFMPKLDSSFQRKNITQKWCLVKSPANTEGYIPLDLLLEEPPRKSGVNVKSSRPSLRASSSRPLLKSDSSPSSTKMTVTADSLNIRSEPNQWADIVGRLERNSVVDVLELSANEDEIGGTRARWARIDYAGMAGWAFTGYMRPGDRSSNIAPGENPEDLKKGETRYVKSELLRVRDQPGVDGTVLFSLPHRERVRITDVIEEVVSLAGNRSKWVEVAAGDSSGWVFGAFLSKDSNAFSDSDDINKLFIFPFNDPTLPITSNYGWRTLSGQKNKHNGIDIGASCATPTLAAADGTVVLVRRDDRNCTSCGYGNYIIIEHRSGYRSLYGHLSAIMVNEGQKLNAGEVIGKVGNTGHSFGCHLHFEIRANEEYTDPASYIHAYVQEMNDFIIAATEMQ